MTFEQENNELFNGFLNDYFYKDFRNGQKSIELIISPKCNAKCFPAGTRIKMSDFSEKNIEDINVGDEIIGFNEFKGIDNKTSKIKKTVVTKTFTNHTNELITFTFENGTQLTTTPDHPILTDRGSGGRKNKFRYRQAKRFQVGQHMIWLPFSMPEDVADINNYEYNLGYFIACMMGDGSYHTYSYGNKTEYKIRFAVIDNELTQRFSKSAQVLGVPMYHKPFLVNRENGQCVDAVFANSKDVYEQICCLIDENVGINNSFNYICGYFAGIYDCEGHFDQKNTAIRISNTDSQILNETARCLTYFNIPYITEKLKMNPQVKRKQLYSIRIVNPKGSLNKAKLLSIVQPAIPRKGIDALLLSVHLCRLAISHIEYKKIETSVYNLETECHTYIANGIAVHNCTYCYLSKYGCKTFDSSMFDNSDVIGNLDKILRWMDLNHFVCPIEIFSGELFAQNIGYRVCNYIYEFYKDKPKEHRIKHIVIPTNFTFIQSDECTNRIETLIQNFASIGIPVYLSASFDGKYMEQNRPYTHDLDIPLNYPRDDTYYDKVFEFSKKHNFGFHPMIYYDGIELWSKNFDWFQEQFEKHGIDWQNIYLLQIRNDGWTVEKDKELYKFIQHIIEFAFGKLNNDKEQFVQFLRSGLNGFNILSQPLIEHTRGIGCGLQNTLGIRVSDLSHHVCHRNMYPDYRIGEFVDDNEKVLQYKTHNAELGLVTYGFNTKMQPACIKCPINRLCIGGCLGAQYESNHDLFSPIKSVCQNSWWLMKAIVDGYEHIGAIDLIKQGCSASKCEQIDFLRGFKVNVQ